VTAQNRRDVEKFKAGESLKRCMVVLKPGLNADSWREAAVGARSRV
jgi:hypothetical protein